MIRNYFKIALRNLSRNRLASVLNMAGLSVGMAACLVIYLLVQFELSFDRAVPDKERVFRLVSDLKFGQDDYHNAGVSVPIPAAVREQLTGVEAVAHYYTQTAETVEIPRSGSEPAIFRSQKDDYQWLAFTDQSFFTILPRDWVAGSPQSALSKPDQVVLTEQQARIYFGEASPALIGRTLISQLYNDTLRLTVSGIIKDLVEPSSFDYHTFVSLSTITSSKKRRDNLGWKEWDNTNTASQCLIKVKPGVNVAALGPQVTALAEGNVKEKTERGSRWLRFQPLDDVHFNADYTNEMPIAHRPTLLVLSVVGLFLLLLACINFINLATAQATQRAKEIGIRKTLGSARRQLIGQFLGETFLLTLAATVLALILAQLALKFLGTMVPKGVALDLSRPHLWLFLIGITMATALFAGLYPGVLISRFSPVKTLRNQTGGLVGKAGLRRVLIVAQFVVAQVFIAGALLVGQQLRFMIHTDLGFQREAIVTFREPNKLYFSNDKAKQAERFTLAERIQNLAGVERVSMGNQTPIYSGWSSTVMKFQGKKEKVNVNVYTKYGDTEYLRLYGLKLLAGRNFMASDTMRELVVNEAMARQIGFQRPADAIGQLMEFNNNKFPIVGVLKDYHHRSMHTAIQPTALISQKSNLHLFQVKLRQSEGESFDQTLAQVGKLWTQTYPGEPFAPEFFDDSVAKLYSKEQDLEKLVNLATGLAVFISCLGLFGLVTFTAERRTKEIGIRKVLGASVASLVALLSRDFLVLILFAIVIASPLAWWAISHWLQDFAYKIQIQWWVFIASGLLAIGIALLTVGFQSVKAALMNPVKSLKSE